MSCVACHTKAADLATHLVTLNPCNHQLCKECYRCPCVLVSCYGCPACGTIPNRCDEQQSNDDLRLAEELLAEQERGQQNSYLLENSCCNNAITSAAYSDHATLSGYYPAVGTGHDYSSSFSRTTTDYYATIVPNTTSEPADTIPVAPPVRQVSVDVPTFQAAVFVDDTTTTENHHHEDKTSCFDYITVGGTTSSSLKSRDDTDCSFGYDNIPEEEEDDTGDEETSNHTSPEDDDDDHNTTTAVKATSADKFHQPAPSLTIPPSEIRNPQRQAKLLVEWRVKDPQIIERLVAVQAGLVQQSGGALEVLPSCAGGNLHITMIEFTVPKDHPILQDEEGTTSVLKAIQEAWEAEVEHNIKQNTSASYDSIIDEQWASTLQVGGLDHFKKRVVFTPIYGNGRNLLERAQTSVIHLLKSMGLVPADNTDANRPFVPHITLCKLKQGAKKLPPAVETILVNSKDSTLYHGALQKDLAGGVGVLGKEVVDSIVLCVKRLKHEAVPPVLMDLNL